MIRNKYEVLGDTTIIHVEKRNGEKFEVLIDTEDLELLDQLNMLVSVQWHRGTEDYYARMTKYISKAEGGPSYQILMLHRLIMDAQDNEEVDHKDHNTLDNRKRNLRKTLKIENCKNRSGKNSNNKTGYRNVCWIEKDKRYIVQLQVNGKNTRLGSFKDVHEAGRFADEMRKKYYGEFSGKN
ncbi:AP2 domain-containing protein [Paenibacillus elgii]|uniref:AP2 domain-containing protein n=1 Tax=Paenibacillus elgii TaxID=189691 RepID=UPI0005855A14|nr:AP2 domain-containing protein [Paenibacillus elgii]